MPCSIYRWSRCCNLSTTKRGLCPPDSPAQTVHLPSSQTVCLMIRHPTALPLPEPVPPLGDKYLLEEILLRLPPQPSSLPRAFLVCTRWRNILSDPNFRQRFRRHHQKPPLLGFFAGHVGSSAVFIPTLDAPDRIPTTRFPLQQNRRYHDFSLRGCHNGLAILVDDRLREAIVWDPLTGHDHPVLLPPRFLNYTNTFVKNIVVLCANTEAGHEHGDCGLSPFKVVLVCSDLDETQAFSCQYDSESGVWGNTVSVATTHKVCSSRPGIIAGNSVYWLLSGGGVLEFDLGRQSLLVIEKPTNVHFTGEWYFQILWTKENGLGLAILLKSKVLQLWGRKSKNNDGAVGWVLQKTVQLNQILPPVSPKDRKKTCIAGYDDNSNTIVLNTTVGASMVQLETLESRNIPGRSYATYYPYANFYTAGIEETSRSQKGELCMVERCLVHDPDRTLTEFYVHNLNFEESRIPYEG